MAPSDKNEIYLSSSPHSGTPFTTRKLMLMVIAALLPVAGWGVYLFGIPALVNIVVAGVSCVVFEALFRKLTGQDVRVGDFSAVITGLLLAMVSRKRVFRRTRCKCVQSSARWPGIHGREFYAAHGNLDKPPNRDCSGCHHVRYTAYLYQAGRGCCAFSR